MKKKAFLWAAVMAGMLAVFPILGQAAGTEGVFQLSDASGKPGETVSVTVQMTENPGIIAAALEIEYDRDVLRLVNSEDGKVLKEPVFSDSLDKNPYYVSWNDALAARNNTDTGTLVTLTFEILEDAQPGQTELQLTFDDNAVFDWNLENVSFSVRNGAVTVLPEESQASYGSYIDLPEDAWYRTSVEYMLGSGLMVGMGDGIFAPDETVTRAQFVMMLYRIADCPGVSGLSNPFVDVERGSWYADAVIWGAANEVVKGITEDTFAPDEKITREQLATLLFRYDCAWPVNRNHLGKYRDGAAVSEYARDAVNWAVGRGIVNGVTADTLEPGESATRAQAAAMLHRYLNPPDVSVPIIPDSDT